MSHAMANFTQNNYQAIDTLRVKRNHMNKVFSHKDKPHVSKHAFLQRTMNNNR